MTLAEGPTGELVGGYRLIRKLGEGSVGEAYLARHPSAERTAVVKVLFPQACADATLLECFFDDVKAASLVNHSGIADLYDCGVLSDGRGFLIMEHLQGKTLTDALIELGQVTDTASLADIAWQVAVMLRAAHEARIVHAALKPDAIFLTFPPGQAPRPLVKLMDFGLARFKLGVRHSQTGSLLGAPLYMSPEIGRGLANVDHRADIYSLGCIMFEMACGRPPFIREGQGELIIAHATEPAPFVSSLEPSVPPALDQLIGRMLTKNPSARPQDMGEVAAVLEKLFDRPAPVAGQAAPLPPSVRPQPTAVGPLPAQLAGPAPAHLGVHSPALPQVLPRDPRDATAVLPPPCAEEAHVRPAPEPTALLPPETPAAVSSTAVLSPEPGSSWLAQVRRRTLAHAPAREDAPPVRPRVPMPGGRPQSATRAGPVGPSFAPPIVAGRAGAFQAINVPVVVISAVVLLALAAVVLLVRRDSGRSPESKAPAPALIHSGAEPAEPVPETPAVTPAVKSVPSVPAAAEGDSDGTEDESSAQDGWPGEGLQRAHRSPAEGDGKGEGGGRSRRRW